MNRSILPAPLRALTLGTLLTGLLPVLTQADTALATWTFAGANNRTLNTLDPSGPGHLGPTGRFDVAVPGVSTQNNRLRVRNPGRGGAGRRTTYANFAQPTTEPLYLRLEWDAWNLTGAPTDGGPTVTVALIEGNDDVVAGVTLLADAEGLAVTAGPAAGGDGTASGVLRLAAASGDGRQSLLVAVDYAAGTWRLGRATGESDSHELLASGQLNSRSTRVHSVRLGLTGDFTVGGQASRFLDLLKVEVATGLPPFAGGGGPGAGSYAAWEAGLGLPPGTIGGPLDDPDGDGVPNLLEFALGGNPLVPGSVRPGSVGLTGSGPDARLRLRFPRNPAAEEVELRWWFSRDLTTWEDATALLEVPQEVPTTDDEVILEVVAPVDELITPEQPGAFFRLEATLPPS